MKKSKTFARMMVMVVLTTFLGSTTSFAWYSNTPQITTNYNYDHHREKLTHNGLVWDVETGVTKTTTRTSDNGTRYDYSDDVEVAGPSAITTTVGRINESGNLEISTKDKPDIEGAGSRNFESNGSPYYSAKLNGVDNPGTGFDSANIGKNSDLEIKFKYQDRLQLYYYVGKNAKKYSIDFFTDSKIYYNDENDVQRAIEADVAWNVWHTLKLSTRDGKIGTIYLDGKEVLQYQLPRSGTNASELMIRTYNHIENQIQSGKHWGTPEQYFEVEYVTINNSPTGGQSTLSTAQNDKTAKLSIPKTANYGASITASVQTTNISDISEYEYYVNGVLAQKSESGTVTLSGLRAGTAAIKAKVVCGDGTEYMTETQYIDVNKGAIASNEAVNMSREYRFDYDYDGTSGSNVAISDGYFNLSFTYGNNSISYTNQNGTTETYTGTGSGIGAGKYRIVATAGNAEVYYNNHFLFSCLLPYTNSGTQNITYSGGITNAKLYASGVKAEKFLKEWTTASSVEAYGLDFDSLYTLEFNKSDQQSETVVVYDGEYQGKLIFDERGITTLEQPKDYKIPKEVNLADTITPGYYRLTVAQGLAQLFVNNVYINSFKCPYNPHAKSVMRSGVSSATSRMVSIKNTDDVYYHKDTFEDITEYGADEYWFSESEGLAAATGEQDAFTQSYEQASDGNKYIKITDTGLAKPYYAAAAEAKDSTIQFSQPIGDWNLNVVADNPVIKWRAKADGTGEIHFIARHYRKYHFVSVSYDFATNRWKVNRYTQRNKDLEFEANPNDESIDGNVKFTKVYYPFEEVLKTSNAASPGTGWNDYEMVVDDGKIKLFCNGTEVISCDGLAKSYGKIGFGVRNGASLCIDDVEYAGNGKATLGLNYFTIDMDGDSSYQKTSDGKTVKTSFEAGTRDFYKDDDGLGVVACGTNAIQHYTLNGGKTWNRILDSDGHPTVSGPGINVLNLMSGGFMQVANASWGKRVYDEWLGTEVLDREKGRTRLTARIYPDTNRNVSLNGNWADERIAIDPPDFELGGYNTSNIGSQLIQIYDGPYKGRVFITQGIGGERYGGEALFYTDVDVPFVNGTDNLTDYWTTNTAGNQVSTKLLNAVWHNSQTPITYQGVGVDFAETKVVGLPDGKIRLFGRTSNGFLYYSDSNDGGAIWSKAVPSQFIAPRCSYGVACDPQNPNTYYAFWTYDTNTVYKVGDGGTPRFRTALAVSYDAMQTWQYVTDIDDATFDWKMNHDGVTAISAIEDHGLRVIDGVVYMNYDGQGTNFTKLFSIDSAKIKTLKRFTSVHNKKVYYTDGAKLLLNKAAVLPKTTGMGKIYGTDIRVEVTDGAYSDSVLAKAFKTTASSVSGKTVTQLAAQTGKKVVETDNAYIISDTEIGNSGVRYLEGLAVHLSFDADNRQNFLNIFNKAAEYGDTEKMSQILANGTDMFGESADFSNTEAVEKMAGFNYYKADDITTVYDMLCTAQSGNNNSLVLSSIKDGYGDWTEMTGKNAAKATISGNTITVTKAKGYTDSGEFGTAAFEIPDCDTYALNFDVKTNNCKDTKIKWGNSTGAMQLAINPDSGFAFGDKPDEIPIELTANRWYNIGVLVQKSGKRYNVTVKKSLLQEDGSVESVAEQTFSNVTGTTGKKGFWIESGNGGSVSARKIRIYTDRAVELVEFYVAGNKASATINILNFDSVFPQGQTVMTLFNDGAFAGSAYSEVLTGGLQPFETKTIMFNDVVFDAKPGINPTANFYIWNDTLKMQPISEPLKNVLLDNEFVETFSGLDLASSNWTFLPQSSDTAFVGIENGELKMSKTGKQTLQAKNFTDKQANNAVLSFDFKVNAATVQNKQTGDKTQFQIHWYSSAYTDADNTKKINRRPFYIITKDDGKLYINCDGSYEIDKNVWYSIAAVRTFDGTNCSFDFYIKERGAATYQRLWPWSCAGQAIAPGSLENAVYFYEGAASDFDIRIDNIKVKNGGLES